MQDYEKWQPSFDFSVPLGYKWLLERKLVGFESFGPLTPWHYLDRNSYFEVTQRWPEGACKDRLVAFAARQDTDDFSCFLVKSESVAELVVIHGWTDNGYQIVDRYDTFWQWLKSIVDDIAEVAEIEQ